MGSRIYVIPRSKVSHVDINHLLTCLGRMFGWKYQFFVLKSMEDHLEVRAMDLPIETKQQVLAYLHGYLEQVICQ